MGREDWRAEQFEVAPMTAAARLPTMAFMLDVNTLKAEDLRGLSKGAVTEIAAALLAQLATQQAALSAKDEHIARRDREIKFKDAKI